MGGSNSELFELKLHTLTQGIVLSDAARDSLSESGTQPLTIHEYATTGGVTFRIGDVFVNAPFDDWYVDRSQALLDLDADGQTCVDFEGARYQCEVLPLPRYLEALTPSGTLVTETTMSHCDRIRVSPIDGCALDCGFCDMADLAYRSFSADEILAGIEVAKADRGLPPAHLLISGGSPGASQFEWFDQTIVRVIRESGLPTDVMMSPRKGDLDYLDRYAEAGVVGYSFNLEVFGEASARAIMPKKHSRSSVHFERTVARAVELHGAGTGRVRSIVIVGLDDYDTTLQAVDLIASAGADPVLSPFRPARNTRLEHWEPPAPVFLRDVYQASHEIAAKHGVKLGPRCIPCQHNTLVMPEGEGYFYWAAGGAA